jgi:hypothetical protein
LDLVKPVVARKPPGFKVSGSGTLFSGVRTRTADRIYGEQNAGDSAVTAENPREAIFRSFGEPGKKEQAFAKESGLESFPDIRGRMGTKVGSRSQLGDEALSPVYLEFQAVAFELALDTVCNSPEIVDCWHEKTPVVFEPDCVPSTRSLNLWMRRHRSLPAKNAMPFAIKHLARGYRLCRSVSA